MFPSDFNINHPFNCPQCDHEELRNVLKQKGSKDGDNEAKRVDLFLRLKCTLTSRGRSVNIKSASYKVSFNFNSLELNINHVIDRYFSR